MGIWKASNEGTNFVSKISGVTNDSSVVWENVKDEKVEGVFKILTII